MEYIIKNDQKVCNKGFIVIDKVEHYVLGGFVYCNSSLNGRSWNTTTKESECNICSTFKQRKYVQQKLF